MRRSRARPPCCSTSGATCSVIPTHSSSAARHFGRAWSRYACATAASSRSRMPDRTRRPPGSTRAATIGARRIRAAPVRLATTTDAFAGSTSATACRRSSTSAATRLASTLRRAEARASGSRSTPVARRAPSLTAAMARTPEPVPRSSTWRPVRSTCCRPRRASRVLGWWPVPKPRAGRMVTVTSSGPRAGGVDQGGATTTRPARTAGRPAWERAAQFSSETETACARTRFPWAETTAARARSRSDADSKNARTWFGPGSSRARGRWSSTAAATASSHGRPPGWPTAARTSSPGCRRARRPARGGSVFRPPRPRLSEDVLDTLGERPAVLAARSPAARRVRFPAAAPRRRAPGYPKMSLTRSKNGRSSSLSLSPAASGSSARRGIVSSRLSRRSFCSRLRRRGTATLTRT